MRDFFFKPSACGLELLFLGVAAGNLHESFSFLKLFMFFCGFMLISIFCKIVQEINKINND